MQQVTRNPFATPEALSALSEVLRRKAAEAEQAESTGPEPLGDIAPKATAEIIGRDRKEDTQ